MQFHSVCGLGMMDIKIIQVDRFELRCFKEIYYLILNDFDKFEMTINTESSSIISLKIFFSPMKN